MPKYKKLAKFRQPLWLEKSGKIKKFNRQKWELKKKAYFPRKYKFFNQDVTACNVGKNFDDEKFVRLKKTYKFLLQDKQRLQLYYGGGHLRYYLLKKMARKAFNISNTKKVSTGKIMLNLLESRVQNNLYRLGYVSSLMQARRLINCEHLKINNRIIKNTNILLNKFDTVVVDPAILSHLAGRYLRSSFPFFFFRYKIRCKDLILKKNNIFFQSHLSNTLESSLCFSKSKVEKLKTLISQQNTNVSKTN